MLALKLNCTVLLALIYKTVTLSLHAIFSYFYDLIVWMNHPDMWMVFYVLKDTFLREKRNKKIIKSGRYVRANMSTLTDSECQCVRNKEACWWHILSLSQVKTFTDTVFVFFFHTCVLFFCSGWFGMNNFEFFYYCSHLALCIEYKLKPELCF